MVFLLVLGIVLISRLYFLQVVTHSKWTALAENQHSTSAELGADRGEVAMRDGEGNGLYPLAVNREYQMIFVSPKDVIDKDHTAVNLSRVLGIDVGVIMEKLDRPNDPFEIVKHKLSDDEITEVKALGLKGVGLMPERYRYYPGGELAAQVVGFASLGPDGGAGGYGIEASLDNQLRGETGAVTQEKDAGGRWIPLSDRDVVSAKNGDKIVLALDRVVQYETEKILREAMDQFQADSGSVVVMDAQTGAVLAMTSLPTFDPNRYAETTDYSLFLNPVTSVAYEPGSVMKPFTVAAGLEEGKIAPTTEYVDTGAIHEAGYTIRNSEDKVYGRSTMMAVLENSINTGVIFVEKLLGNHLFHSYIENFGFGRRTGVQLPAELAGNLHNLENERSNIQYFTASFGQGITATPLQLVTAYAALGNGGYLMQPQIIDRVIHSDGSEEKIERKVIRQVIGTETSVKISQMLRSVVTKGHGKRADVPGYTVCGKTGTAQVSKKDGPGYDDSLTIGTFVGYAPQEQARFAVLVKLDNPKGVQWAESSVAPTFGKIMKFLLEYAKVKPTEVVISR